MITTSENPTVALIGPGAIGTTVAAALYEVGRAPTICGRSGRAGLELRHDGGRIVVPGPIRTDPRDIRGHVDLVVLAVKATQVEAAGPWLSALCSTETVICVLQNGVEQRALLAPYAPGPVLPAVVWFPAQRESDGSVWLRSEPRLTLPDTDSASTVLAALRGTRVAVDVAADFTTVAWRKLVQNAVAGLQVLSGRRAGMFTRADITELALAYAGECVAVARAEGANLDADAAQEIVDKFQALPADMGTSILADREAGRPVEWDSRNGVIRRLGLAHGVPTPVSDVVVPLLAAASDGPG